MTMRASIYNDGQVRVIGLSPIKIHSTGENEHDALTLAIARGFFKLLEEYQKLK